MEKGAGFYDDISAVAYGSGSSYLFMASGFSRCIYVLDTDMKWSEIDVPESVKRAE